MRRLLIAGALVLCAMPGTAQQVDPKTHKLCKEARDYAGCVKAFTTPTAPQEDSLAPLRNAMKQVAARIRSGFSLRDSTLFFQPLTDQVALVGEKHATELAVKNASKSAELFGIVQSAWQSRIDSLSVGTYTGTTYSCYPTETGVRRFNTASGTEAVTFAVHGGLFGLSMGCQESVGTRHEAMMLAYIASLLESGSISPEEIAAKEKAEQERKTAAARERELCAMGPWNRYLEENPGVKQWAKANPSAAEASKKKFIADPKNQAVCVPGAFNFDVKNNFINNKYTNFGQ